MSGFSKLRTILQQPQPDWDKFMYELQGSDLQKGDLDLLLRKAVESKISPFKKYCFQLIKYQSQQIEKEPTQISATPKVVLFNTDRISNLMLACERGSMEIIQILLKFSQINLLQVDGRQNHCGFYAIQNKSKEQSQKILRMLIQKQPQLVNKDAGNQTLLIAAIRKGKVEVVKMLLQAKADPNWQVPDTGNTPLHDTVKQLKSKPSKATNQILRLLLLHKADPKKKNKQQKSVYEYAQKILPELLTLQSQINKQLQKQKLNTDEDKRKLIIQADNIFNEVQCKQIIQQQQVFQVQDDIIDQLDKQMKIFQNQCTLQYQIAKRQLTSWMDRFQKIISNKGLKAQFYGSFATGLWTKKSNIDIMVLPQSQNISIQLQLIKKIYQELQKNRICRSVLIYPRNQRVSFIRAEVGQGKSRILNINFFQRHQTAQTVVNYIKTQVLLYPQLKSMFFAVKTLTHCYRLSDPKNGGIRTLGLIVMLVSWIERWNIKNLGKLLIDFFYFFGFYYVYEQRDEQRDLSQGGHISLRIIDPVHPNNDLGQRVRAGQLQRMFRSAYIILHTSMNQQNQQNLTPRLKLMLQSHKIILP